MDTRIIVAPMAGGPSTPALVSAAAEAGAFGFLAAGTIGPEQLHADVAALSTMSFGINLFAPQNVVPDPKVALDLLAPEFARHGVEPPPIPAIIPWADMWQAALDARPKVVSTSFGCPTAAEVAQAQALGIKVWASVTSVEEAQQAHARGVDALVVQGVEAGGHRLTWDAAATPNTLSTRELVDAVRAVVDLPVVAAGGIRRPGQWDCPVQLGSVFLLAEEAGTSEANRELLREGGRRAVTTRALSGRYARGLETTFTRANPDLPLMYPFLGQLQAPLRGVGGYEYCLVSDGIAGQLMEAPLREILASLV